MSMLGTHIPNIFLIYIICIPFFFHLQLMSFPRSDHEASFANMLTCITLEERTPKVTLTSKHMLWIDSTLFYHYCTCGKIILFYFLTFYLNLLIYYN